MQGRTSVCQIQNPRTNAVSISEGIVSNLALYALRAGEGMVCTVSEAEIAAASTALARSGILAELSSCVATAAATRLARSGDIDPSARMVSMVTATGLRWSGQLPNASKPPLVVGRDLETATLFEGILSSA